MKPQKTHSAGALRSAALLAGLLAGIEGWAAPGDPIPITVTEQNDAPAVTTNTGITVDEGSSGNAIDTLDLETTDPEQAAGSLDYTISSGPSNGSLSLTSFTQDDIDGDLLTYTHDGSETTSDSFTFTVSDGTGTTSSTDFDITVTPVDDGPTLATNAGLTVDEAVTVAILSPEAGDRSPVTPEVVEVPPTPEAAEVRPEPATAPEPPKRVRERKAIQLRWPPRLELELNTQPGRLVLTRLPCRDVVGTVRADDADASDRFVSHCLAQPFSGVWATSLGVSPIGLHLRLAPLAAQEWFGVGLQVHSPTVGALGGFAKNTGNI
ncbi:MAG: hypothetical protein JRI25_26730, partial [Deltaproteobacteria bacterium]|nr:hypothetical protein [Deltaproteobacteria bacterium]